MTEYVISDTPPEGTTTQAADTWKDRLQAAVDHPGKWLRVALSVSRDSANTTTSALRTTKKTGFKIEDFEIRVADHEDDDEPDKKAAIWICYQPKKDEAAA